MNAWYATLLVLVAALAACTSTEHTTDKQAAMARMTFTPGQHCQDGQGAWSACGNDHVVVPSYLGGRGTF